MKFFKNDMLALLLALCASLALVACGDDDDDDGTTDTGADVTQDDTMGDDTSMDDGMDDDTTMDDAGDDTTMDDAGDDTGIVDAGDDTGMDDVMEDTGPIEPEFTSFLCVGVEDLEILAAGDVNVTGEAQDCGLGCLGDPDAGACAQDCVETATGLTPGCSGCYAGVVVCSIENCLAPCAADPTSDACTSCQAENCIGDFDNCTGVVGESVDLCLGEADMALIEEGGVTGEAQDCGLGCLGDDDASLCASRCVLDNTGVSAGCSTCYAGVVVCSIENCLAPCAADPTSDACTSCQAENCIGDFDICTGLGETGEGSGEGSGEEGSGQDSGDM